MTRFLTVLVLAAAAVAMPSVPRQASAEELTNMRVGEAQPMCGNNLQISCCNSESTSADGDKAPQGLLPGLVDGVLGKGGLGLFDQCSPLSVSGIIGAGDLLSNHCRAKVACCDRSQTVTGGLINIGLPCVALGSIVA